MKVVLPNRIEIHTEGDGDVDALMRWLGSAPSSVLGLPSLPVSPPPPAVEKDEAKPAVEPSSEVEKPEPTPIEVTGPAEMGSGSAKREVVSDLAPLDLNKVAASVPRSVGGFKLTAPTAERYWGQIVYLYRCKCGTEVRMCGQVARKKRHPPPCACKPSPAVLPPPGEPLPPSTNPRISGFSTLVGLTFGTWKVVARTGGGEGISYWKCRCTKCGASKDIAALGAHGLRKNPPACGACRVRKGGAKPEDAADDDQEGETE